MSFSPRTVGKVLLAGMAALVAMDLCLAVLNYGFGHDTVLGLARRFELDSEWTVPAWYNAFLLAAGAAACGLVAWLRPPRRATWLAVGALFVFLAFDELMSIHERFAVPMREAFGTSGLLYTAWIIPYLAAIGVLLLVLLPWLRQLPATTRRGLVISGFVYVAGAAAVEAVSGAYRSAQQFEGRNFDFTYDAMTTVEETLEMVGVILFVYHVLGYAGSLMDSVRIVPKR